MGISSRTARAAVCIHSLAWGRLGLLARQPHRGDLGVAEHHPRDPLVAGGTRITEDVVGHDPRLVVRSPAETPVRGARPGPSPPRTPATDHSVRHRGLKAFPPRRRRCPDGNPSAPAGLGLAVSLGPPPLDRVRQPAPGSDRRPATTWRRGRGGGRRWFRSRRSPRPCRRRRWSIPSVTTSRVCPTRGR